MNRAHALRVLEETKYYGGNPVSIDLRKLQSGSYELHYRPSVLSAETLKHIAETHGLKIREDSEKVIFF